MDKVWFCMELLITVIFIQQEIYAQRLFGKYVTQLLEVENMPSIPHTKANWQFRLRKTSRYETKMQGYMLVKEKVGPLTAQFTYEEWKTGGWKKSTFGEMDIPEACKSPLVREFLAGMNVTEMFDPTECTLTPGKAYMEKFDMDKAVKEMFGHHIIYGKYRSDVIIKSDDEAWFGIRVIYEFKDATLQ